MQINSKILSIPPYISTAWRNIASLHVEIDTLVITLNNSARIQIPQLEGSIIEAIFKAHAKYMQLEQPQTKPAKIPHNESSLSFGIPLKPGMGLESFGSLLQHNPEQSDSPDLPNELLSKITSLSKTMPVNDPDMIPKPEPHCNCAHCQISKALQTGFNSKLQQVEEEIVSDEDLKFHTWDIAQSGDKLYTVTSVLDNQEHYNVYLGEPLGCTCGEKNCEHIKAVLSS